MEKQRLAEELGSKEALNGSSENVNGHGNIEVSNLVNLSDVKDPEHTVPEVNGSAGHEEIVPSVDKEEVEPKEENGSVEEKKPEAVESEVEKKSEVEELHPLAGENDFSKSTKDELLSVLDQLSKIEDYQLIGKVLKEVRPVFDGIVKAERKAAFDKFIEDGGEKDGFEYRDDSVTLKFNASYNLLWEKRQSHYKNLEKQKESNLEKKTSLLEQLRELVDGEESGSSINSIKRIQEEWKAVGPIPKQHSRTLWANYNALMDRFYDNRSIYFELKELDRKKNLQLKNEVCERAEALAIDEDVNLAVKQLNSLHEEFKHIGPVPQESQEEIWLRFKAASDTIYSKRKVYVDEVKEKLNENLDAKIKLCEELEGHLSFNSDRITEWNDQTKIVLGLQDRWEKAGGLPRDKSKAVNKRFWSAFKGFFANKNKFFKSLEGQKEDNLKLKEGLVAKAEELKSNSDINKTANELKKLQKQWREIGPVPEKFRNEVYDKFKTACDEFFNRKRESVKESEKEFVENLKRKQEVCDQLEAISNEDKIDLDIVDSLQVQFAQIGFVPRSELKKMNSRYDEVVDGILQKVNESDLPNKEQIALEIEIRKAKGRPGANKSIQKQENNLRRQITSIENDISTWKNNLEFFRDSKTADQLRKDFDVKINEANQQLKTLKKQLRLMQSASN